MSRSPLGWMTLVAIFACPRLVFAQEVSPDSLLTVAERSDYKATARHAEVVGLMERMAQASPLIRLTELGKSGEGRSIPLMIVADPPVTSAAEARASGKVVVFLFGNIHAGEVDGKEALPILVREIVSKPEHPLLNHLILAVAPIYNTDGNERVSLTNRPGQVGPEQGMGVRANAQGLDLNRDYMKLEAPETRALVRFLNEWDPHLIVDTHTTNGSHHRYTMTFDGPKNPAADRRLIAFSREKLFPESAATLEKSSPYKAFYYGNFESDHTRWTSFPATPRFGTTYFGLRNRLSVLTEAYSYASFKDRVLVTRDYCRALLEFTAEHRDEIKTLLDSARRQTSEAGRDPKDQVAIRTKARPMAGKVTVMGFVERLEGNRSVATTEPKDYQCDLEIDFAPTLEVPRPFAYLIPPDRTQALGVLQAHGIAFGPLGTDTPIEVESDRIVTFTRARRPFEKHETIDVVETATTRATRTIPGGTLVVRTAQPLGTLAVYLLEPRSDDSLTTWNGFDDILGPGKDREYPILRVRKPF